MRARVESIHGSSESGKYEPDESTDITVPELHRLIIEGEDGAEWEVEVEDHSLRLTLHKGGTILTVPSGYSNVVYLVNWPSFQPVEPPDSIAFSRQEMIRLGGEHYGHNGLASDLQREVQEAINKDPEVKARIAHIVRSTLPDAEWPDT